MTPELVTAVATAIVLVFGAFVAGYVKIVTTLAELKKATFTANGKAVGALAEAAETRRISRVPAANRTEEEQQHIEKIPLPERPLRDGVTLPEGGVVVDTGED